MASRIVPRPLGPFPKGVIDRGNPSQLDALQGAVRRARGLVFSGANRMAVRPGTVTSMTLVDDQGSPANVTTVCCATPFTDMALAVAYSSTTNKVYIYQIVADFTGWYDSGGTLHTNTTAQPSAVLWTGVTTAPDVTIAEGLGVAYIAMNAAISATTLAFPSLQFTPPNTVANLTANLDNINGVQPIYFLGVVGFQQALWGWGFGGGITSASGYRPELARFSPPNFALPFAASDSITVGDRVRSQREQIVAGAVAGQSLFLATPYSLTRVTGYGRTSWYKEPLDKSFGVAGLKALTARGNTLYYWSNRGPMRCPAMGMPEPLWPSLENALVGLINPQRIVAGYDETSDLVMFFYDAGAGVRTWCGFDATRECWVGPDDDIGIVITAAGSVAPIYSSTVNAPAGSVGPAGPPTTPSTTAVGAMSAIANWASGDPTAQTSVEYRRQGDPAWIVTLVAAGVTSYQFSGLTAATAYEWRAAHFKGGSLSSYLGPVTATQFTTGTQILPPTNLAVSQVGSGAGYVDIGVSWTPGEPGANTIVQANVGPAGSYVIIAYVTAPATSTTYRVTVSNTYGFEVNHALSGFTNSTVVGPQSIAVTV